MAVTFSSYTARRAVASDNDYTAPAGSDRVLFFLCAEKGDQTTDNPVASLTFGAQAATNLVATSRIYNSFRSLQYSLWYIKEADIPAGSNLITVDQGTANTIYVKCWAAFGVDQTANPTASFTEHTQAGGAGTFVHSMGANSGKVAIACCFSQGHGGTSGWTVVPDVGTALFAYDDSSSHGLGWINSSVATHSTFNVFNTLANDTTDVTWDVDYTESGASTVGNRVAFTAGIYVEEVGAPPANPTLTITEASLEPGGTISGTYSDFAVGVAPTSPITISDGVNTMAATITPSDDGDGTGSFTGTIKTLPDSGNSDTFVLFGNVTATLDDA